MKLFRGTVAVAIAATGLSIAPMAHAGSALDTFKSSSKNYVTELAQPMSCITKRGTLDARSPMFYGCWDWHSAVHGHWGLYAASAITGNSSFADSANRNMPASKFDAEMSYMDTKPITRNSDRTYGFAWLLKLAVEREKSTGNRDFRDVADKAANSLAARLPSQPVMESEYSNASWSALRLHEYAAFTGNAALKQTAAQVVASNIRNASCSVANDTSTGFFPRCWMKMAAIAEVEGPAAADYLRSQTSGVRYAFIPNNPDSHMNGLNFYAAYALAKVAKVTGDQGLKENAASLINEQMASPSGWKYTYTSSHWVPQVGTLATQALLDADAAPAAAPAPKPVASPSVAVPTYAPVAPVQTPSPSPKPSASWMVPTYAPVQEPLPVYTPSAPANAVDDEEDDNVDAAPAPAARPEPVQQVHPFVAWWRRVFGWG